MDDDIRQFLKAREFRPAFELLVDRYRQKVFHLALSMLRQPALAEDLAQDILLRVWKGLPGFDGRAALSTWIYTIARNTCLTEIGRRQAKPTVSLHDLEWEATVDSLSALQVHDAETTAGADSAAMLAHLPENQRRVITLFYLEQRSYEETAEILGVPLGTVKTYLHRARKELLRLAARPHRPDLPASVRLAYGLR